MPSDRPQTLRFGDFELDLAAYELRRSSRRIRLERRPMDLLLLFVERRGELVTREDIVERLWGTDVFIDVETGINTVVRKVRQALRDSPTAPRYVETVQGKGYRFIAGVEVVSERRQPSSGHESRTPGGDNDPPAPAGNGAPSGVMFDGTAAIGDILPATAAEVATRPEPQPSSRGRRDRQYLGTGLLASVLAVSLAGVAWYVTGSAPARVTLAVLPFENIARDPAREYLADGLTEEITALLGRIDPERLGVIARTSTVAYKATTKSIAEIGRDLGVDYIVESSIRTEGQRLRITAKLARVRDQAQIWSASYDSEPSEMLDFQGELSAAIAEQIRLRLSPERLSELARRQTRDAEAYDLYLRGRHLFNRFTPPTTQQALVLFVRATERDPEYALAWAGLADAYAASPINGDANPLHMAPQARDAVTRAVAAGPDLAEPQVSLGLKNFFLEWKWETAEANFRQAIAIDPNSSVAHRTLGVLLAHMGRPDEARSAIRRSRELDPLSPMQHALSAQVAFAGRDHAAAIQFAKQATVVEPAFWIGYLQLGQALEQAGQLDLALDALDRAGQLSGNSKSISLRGYILARRGQHAEAQDVLATLEAISRERYMPPYAMALVYSGLGQPDAAFEWLERAFEARDVHLIHLPVDHKWDALRADPRFGDLLGRCGFTSAHRP